MKVRRKLSIAERTSKAGHARAAALTAEERKAISDMGVEARQRKLTPAKRRAIAKRAALARWSKRAS